MKKKWNKGEDRSTYTDEWWENLICKYFPSASFKNYVLPYDVCRVAIVDGQELFHSSDDGSYGVAVVVGNTYDYTKNKQRYIEMLVDFVVKYREKDVLTKNQMLKDLARSILNHPIYNKINYWIKDISMPTPKGITITAQSIDDPASEVEIQLTQREHKVG